MSKDKKNLKDSIENFLYSDTVPAVTTKFILALVAVGGVAFGGAIIPGIIKVVKEFENSSNYSDKKITASFYALKRRKFVKIIKCKNGKTKVKLTGKGEKRVREFIVDNIQISEPKRWDKKWRILIFDIPVEFNNARNSLRRKVKKLGFYQFQGSVWFYPYSCEDEILTVAEFFKVSEYIEIITAESILHEKELKKYFKLK